MNTISKNTSFALRHEIVHSIIHGMGILFGIISIPILISFAIKNGNSKILAGVSIYGFCFLMMFTVSTLYHSFQHPRVKRVLEIFDHICVYFLIAGTYTPFLLIYFRNSFGIALLSVLWGLTLFGIFFKIYFTGRFEIISVIIYLAMGWILIAGGRSFFTVLPNDVLIFILIGGGLYSMGIIFYLWPGFPLHHALWHFLVLAAAICHYVAVLLAVC